MTIQMTFIIIIALALPISNLLLQQQQLAMAELSEDTIERLIPTFDNALNGSDISIT